MKPRPRSPRTRLIYLAASDCDGMCQHCPELQKEICDSRKQSNKRREAKN